METEKFDERKEIVTRLHEPYKIKLVAVTSVDPEKRGHMIQVEVNVSWSEIDTVFAKDSDLAMAIQNAKDFITDVLDSRYLGVQKVEN